MCISLCEFVRNDKFYESRIYRAPFYAELIKHQEVQINGKSSYCCCRGRFSVYVTSSFRSSNEFHIYKSTGDFIHEILLIV